MLTKLSKLSVDASPISSHVAHLDKQVDKQVQVTFSQIKLANYQFSLLIIPSALKKLANLTGIFTLSSFLVACGGGGAPSSATPSNPPTPKPTPVPAISDIDAARFLQQAQFSSTLPEIELLKSQGIEMWLETQFAMPISQRGYDWLSNYAFDREKFLFWGEPSQPMMWYQLFTAPDTLRKRVALALSEIFVVSVIGLSVRHPAFALANYWDILNTHAFGNYRALLESVTLSSAMASYLSTLGNKKANPATGSQADENYAREILQLFSIGLVELNLDGSQKLDDKGNPIETYDNKQIAELAKVFTGYELGDGKYAWQAEPTSHVLPIKVMVGGHDTTQKQVFGTVRPADSTPETALKMALDAIANHSNVAPFISKQLIQRLVCSNPTPSYIKRVAQVFENNGRGVRGDLKAVIRAILTDNEARQAPSVTNVTQGKVREPMITYIQWVRTFTNRTSVSGKWNLGNTSSDIWALSQSPFYSPSVFNFYRPSYAPSLAEFKTNNTVAPELYLVNETALTGYQNLIKGFIERGVSDKDDWRKVEIDNDFSQLLALAPNPQALVERINLIVACGQLSQTTQQYILQALNLITEKMQNWQTKRVHAVLYMTLISPDYRVQK